MCIIWKQNCATSINIEKFRQYHYNISIPSQGYDSSGMVPHTMARIAFCERQQFPKNAHQNLGFREISWKITSCCLSLNIFETITKRIIVSLKRYKCHRKSQTKKYKKIHKKYYQNISQLRTKVTLQTEIKYSHTSFCRDIFSQSLKQVNCNGVYGLCDLCHI